MTNIELKAKYNDIEFALNVTQSLGATFHWQDEQIDTYYKVPMGRLKLRQCGRDSAELIAYKRENIMKKDQINSK